LLLDCQLLMVLLSFVSNARDYTSECHSIASLPLTDAITIHCFKQCNKQQEEKHSPSRDTWTIPIVNGYLSL
jgi:hypothetical protein